ncbi:hypothetical protein RFI_02705, partial [Reticulomyxa filosa]
QSESKEKNELDLLEYVLSLYPCGIRIDCISSVFEYLQNTWKEKEEWLSRMNDYQWMQKLNSHFRQQKLKSKSQQNNDKVKPFKKLVSNVNSSNRLLSRCRVIDGVVLALKQKTTLFKVNNNATNRHLNGTYSLYTPLVFNGYHPHAQNDLLQSRVDLRSCNGGFYLEYINYYFWIHYNKCLVLEGPMFETKSMCCMNDSKRNAMVELTWQINEIRDINHQHQLTHHYASFLFDPHSLTYLGVSSIAQEPPSVACLQPYVMSWDVSIGDQVWVYIKDDCTDESDFYSLQTLKCSQLLDVAIPAKVVAIDVFCQHNALFSLELSECWKLGLLRHSIDGFTQLDFVRARAVHLNELRFIEEYKSSIFDDPRVIKVYIDGFTHGIPFEETDINKQVANILKVIDDIIQQFHLMMKKNVTCFGCYCSFTSLLPSIYHHVCTTFSSRISNIQLLAFLNPKIRSSFQNDWRDVVFFKNKSQNNIDNIRIWCVLKDLHDCHQSAPYYSLAATQSKYVLCFGGGKPLQIKYLQFIKYHASLKSTKQKIKFYIFNLHKYKYVLGQVKKEETILLSKQSTNEHLVRMSCHFITFFLLSSVIFALNNSQRSTTDELFCSIIVRPQLSLQVQIFDASFFTWCTLDNLQR